MPKAMVPVDNVALVDLALERVATVSGDVAVNVHHGRDLMERHLAGRVHLSIEQDRPLGTAGGLVQLRDWIAGRGVLAVNADAWLEGELRPFVAGWDGERVRLLVVDDPSRGDFGPWRYAGAALMPWAEVRGLPPGPSGLYEVSWRRARDEGRLDLAPHTGRFFDCGTPAEYLAANLAASGGVSVIGEGAMVRGVVEESVVWPRAVVRRDERLVRAIRAGEQMTVLVR